MASLFERMERRRNQNRGNAFVKTLKNKNENEIKQMYLDSKEFQNNEVVLTYLFFEYPSIISVLPVNFQKTMINSNFQMFKYGSDEAKMGLVSDWLKANKFIINSKSLQLSDEEFENYICMYFNQPEDITKLYMEDLDLVISILAKYDIKHTEQIVDSIKDSLSDRQWDFILKSNPVFIKYANQEIQKKYSDNEEYGKYIIGEARDNYIKNQLDKLKNDLSLLSTMPLDIQREYIIKNPYMINYIDDDIVIELLKYDISFIRFINIPTLQNKNIIYSVLENSKSKSISEIINIFVSKNLLNAKGKLYKYDESNNSLSYQYTKKIIKIIQSLPIEKIIALINIDVNYVLPYVLPMYDGDIELKEKESIILEYNSRCLNLFKSYYDDATYSKYYKSINKMYTEYIANLDEYEYSKDSNCIFELLKLLFNKKVISKNSFDKINVFIGMMLLYKKNLTEENKSISSKLLSDILSNAYSKKIEITNTIYDYHSFEIFDNRLSFIDNNLLFEFEKYNHVNMSTLLYVVKNEKARESFIFYYEILKTIYKPSVELLCKSLENFTYYENLLGTVINKELTDEEIDNLISVLSEDGNYLDINSKDQLHNIELSLLKQLIGDFSETKDEEIYKNLFCRYFFNKTYSEKGNLGWLEVTSIEQLCDLIEPNFLNGIKENDTSVFNNDEINFYSMIKLLLTVKDSELLLSFTENFMNQKVKRNVCALTNFFQKLDKYKTDIINNEIVTLDDIENLYIKNPSAVSKRVEDDVEIYSFNNQDFRILASYTNDGVNFYCKYISELTKNCYGYNKLVNDGNVRISSVDGQTVIKYNEDRIKSLMKPNYIVIIGSVSSDIINVSKKHNLKVIEINKEW